MENNIVTIFIPNNESEHLIVKSLLEDQGIPTLSRNDYVQNLFGLGQTGTGYNYVTGPVKIQINSSDSIKAKTIVDRYLAGKLNDFSDNMENDDKDESNQDSLNEDILVHKYISISLLCSIIWLLGISSIIGTYYGYKAIKIIKNSERRINGIGYAIFSFICSISGILSTFYILGVWFG